MTKTYQHMTFKCPKCGITYKLSFQINNICKLCFYAKRKKNENKKTLQRANNS